MEQKLETKITQIQEWLGTGSLNIFGVPFSGKDTHGNELARYFNAAFISGGDILRSASGPQHIKDHIALGHLAPTDEYLAIVLPYFSQPGLQDKPLILSSVGRWHGEEPSVMEAAATSGHELKAVIHLVISEDEALKRWEASKRNREDDAAKHILLNRFKEFKQKTLPVIEFYRSSGLLIEIDGMPSKEVVTNDILEKLVSKSRP